MIDLHSEYSALRDEILSHLRLRDQNVMATAVATAAILGWGMTGDQILSKYVFLSPLAVVIPSAFYYASRCRVIMKLGSYIEFFHEGKISPGWEVRSQKLEHHPSGVRVEPPREWYTLHYAALGVLSILLFVFAPVIRPDLSASMEFSDIVVALACLLLIAVFEYQILNAYSVRADYLKQWEEISKGENGNNRVTK